MWGTFRSDLSCRRDGKGGLIAGVIVKMAELLKNNLREVLAINDFNSHRER